MLRLPQSQGRRDKNSVVINERVLIFFNFLILSVKNSKERKDYSKPKSDNKISGEKGKEFQVSI